jgi:hypothetical protein
MRERRGADAGQLVERRPVNVRFSLRRPANLPRGVSLDGERAARQPARMSSIRCHLRQKFGPAWKADAAREASPYERDEASLSDHRRKVIWNDEISHSSIVATATIDQRAARDD